MTTAIQFLRTAQANVRPIPGTLDDGMPMLNFSATSPGLFFRLSNDTLTKIGPTSVGPNAPNDSPAGYAGNSVGEMWLNSTSNDLNVYNGIEWVNVTSEANNLDAILGATGADLGTFTGSTIADGSSVKAALQALETTLEAVDIDTDDMAALVGLSENVTNLGTFTGSTIADNSSVKAALQALETELETKASAAGLAASLHLDDVRTALGIAEQSTTFGTFSGTTLQDNDTLPDLLQALETAVEARATLSALSTLQADVDQNESDADAAIALRAHLNQANVFTGEHTLRDKLHIDPGDGGLRLQLNRNASASQMDILLGNVPSGARLNINTVNANADDALVVYSSKFWCRALGGGTGDAEFDGDVLVDGALTVGSTNVATELGLKAVINNTTLTGTLDAEAGDFSGALTVDNDGGYYLKFDRNTTTQIDIITGNIPSGGNLNLKNSNGSDAKVVVYSDLFWCRNLGGSSGNGTAKFDGDVTCGSEIKMTNDYTNKAAAGAGALGDIAVIGGKLCFHDGSDWKEVTLGSAPA